MDKFHELMSKKVAGIPLLYIAGILVATLVAVAIKMKTPKDLATDDDTQTSADAADADTSGGDPSGNGVSQPVFVANPSQSVSATGGPNDDNPITVNDNNAWLAKGVTYLVSQGTATGGDAEDALSKYLNGSNLSYSEGNLRDAVIKQYGLPPEPPASATTSAKPATRQFTHFPGKHTVQTTNDNTYTEIAQLYYGRTDGSTINLLQAANTNLGHQGPYPRGTVINVPAYHAPKFYTATKAKHTFATIAAANGVSQNSLHELNDTLKDPIPVGRKVRVA